MLSIKPSLITHPKPEPELPFQQVIATVPFPYRLILTLMLEIGLSSAELLALNYEDIIFDNNSVRLRLREGVTERLITIALQQAPESVSGLRMHLRGFSQQGPNTPLFCSQRGRRCSYDALHYHWVRACQDCGAVNASGHPVIGLQQLAQSAPGHCAVLTPAPKVDIATAASTPSNRVPADAVTTFPLTITKLLMPKPRVKRVIRERLLARLDQALTYRLILLSAPAGSGKTQLLSEWLGQGATPTAWVSLDETDNDPVRFWAYLSAALAPFLPEAVMVTHHRRERSIEVTVLPTLLINALASLSTPIVLVLDDYHRITNINIHKALDWFLERLPASLHLVIATRYDPPLALAQLRVRDEVAELRLHDLAFTEAEGEDFLSRVMGLALNQAALTQLWTQSEGWIAGLQLAALAARSQTGSQAHQPHISGSQRLLADYLGDEVLRQLSPATQTFLLHTAHLERFCAPLCDAVLAPTNEPTQGSQAMLTALERANLFLIPLDQERHWYRYHHLFADMLCKHPQQDVQTTRTIHQRAARWYAEAGLSDEAIIHALMANDYEYAAALIAPIADIRTWQRGDVLTLLGWLQRIPDSVLQNQPVIRRAQAWALVATRQFAAFDRLLTRIEAATEVPPALDTLDLARLRVVAANMRGDPTAAITLIQAIQLQLTPGSEDLQAGLAIERGMALRTLGDAAAAQEAFTIATRLCQQANNPIRTLLAYSHLGATQTWQGQLHEAATSFQRALHYAEVAGTPDMPATGMAFTWLGRVLYEWGDLVSAEATIRRGLARGAHWWSRDIQMAGIAALARVLAARHDLAGLITLYDDAQLLALRYNLHWPAAVVAMFIAQLYADQGDLSAALAQVNAIRSDRLSTSDGFGRVAEIQSTLHIRLLLAQHNHQQALIAIAAAPGQVVGGGSRTCRIELQMLSVQAYLQAARPQLAYQAFETALVLAEPAGYIQVFLNDYEAVYDLLIQARRQHRPNSPIRIHVERLLRMCPHEVTAAIEELTPALIEPLREREREILLLLAAGHSTRAIAQQLVISAGTVKWHLQNIYTKLQVRSRTQAIARAHELRILT